jgi:NAD(P)-dependent dehydrogenase (short-subunit alcohol dehydrogenase family)
VGVLKGRVAAITGGSWATRLTIAQKFIAEGAEVFIPGRDIERLCRVAAMIGHHVTIVEADPSDPTDLDFFYAEVHLTAGILDVLVAASAARPSTPIPRLTPDEFTDFDNAEERRARSIVQKALPILRESASVILIGTGAFVDHGIQPRAALAGIAQAWTADLTHRYARVNVIAAPGADIWEPPAAGSPSVAPRSAKSTAQSGTIAAAAVFFASHAAGSIAGAEFRVPPPL